MSDDLPGVFHSLSPVLDHHGYAALIVLVGVEGFGIPFPGQTMLIAAGIYASSGHLDLVAVLLLGLLAAIGGDNIGYALGRCAGRRLVLRFGRYVFLTEDRLKSTERFFERRGTLLVPVARFVDGLRQATGFVAGMAQMNWGRFFIYNGLGAVAWVGFWVFLGYLAGDHIGAIYAQIERYEQYVVAAAAAVVVALLVRWVLKRRSESAAPSEA